MKIGIFGACKEGIEAYRGIYGGRIMEDDTYCFIDNDSRLEGGQLEDWPIYRVENPIILDLNMIVIGIIDFEKATLNIKNQGYAGTIKRFYGECYFSKEVRKVGMATIGRYSYFKPSTFLYSVEIGNYCHIGADCRLGLVGHDPNEITTYPLKLKNLSEEYVGHESASPSRMRAPLIVEDDVYIGEGVSVMAGITIGRGSIIGSKSLVTKNVEPYSIVAGIPAKKIGDRLDTITREQLFESNWTSLNIDKATEALERLRQ